MLNASMHADMLNGPAGPEAVGGHPPTQPLPRPSAFSSFPFYFAKGACYRSRFQCNADFLFASEKNMGEAEGEACP